MRGEDSHERLMRLLKEHQDGLIQRVSRGHATADNKAGGYMHIAGQVVGMDSAIAIVRSCLYGEPRTDVQETAAAAYGLEDPI